MIRFYTKVSRYALTLFILSVPLFLVSCSDSSKEKLELNSRYEITHPGKGHELHISAPSVAVAKDGSVIVAWVTKDGEENNLYVARPKDENVKFVRVNPKGTSVDSLHQSPGISAGPNGEIYVSWSSKKPKPEGVLFASDLYISRSLDGGNSFDNHLRVNDDRPISHSFEGLDVGSDGSILISWIDSREGWDKAGTYLAHIVKQGTVVETIEKLDDNTCVCCRVDVARGPKNTVAVFWRKVFPENVRDMVVALIDKGSFRAPMLVHADRWQIDACPHRGGSLAIHGKSRIYASWYTEGNEGQPNVNFSVSSDGKNFSSPKRLDSSEGSIPDHVGMAVDESGDVFVVWEDSTAVRRRILLRYSSDGGKTFSPIHVLSKAIKAYSPDIAASSDGNFVVVWHEEQFPVIKTVVQSIRQREAGASNPER